MKFIFLTLSLFLIGCNSPFSKEPTSELLRLMRYSVQCDSVFFAGEATLGQRVAALQEAFSNTHDQELSIRMEPHVESLPVNIQAAPTESTEKLNLPIISVQDALRVLEDLLPTVTIEYHREEIVIAEVNGSERGRRDLAPDY